MLGILGVTGTDFIPSTWLQLLGSPARFGTSAFGNFAGRKQ